MDRPFSRPDAQQPDYSRRRSKASWIFEKLLFTDFEQQAQPSRHSGKDGNCRQRDHQRKGGKAVNQNKKPSEPVEEERRAELEELDRELELQLQISKDIQELSGMIEFQIKSNRERNREYQKTMMVTIVFQSIALLFVLASLITTIVKVVL
jgi:hypothetical protein